MQNVCGEGVEVKIGENDRNYQHHEKNEYKREDIWTKTNGYKFNTTKIEITRSVLDIR